MCRERRSNNRGCRTACALAFGLVLCAVVSASGQDVGPTPTVRDIRIDSTGPGTVEPTHVLAHIGVRKDEPLNHRQVSSDIKALMGTGLYTYVRVDLETVDDGIRLVYRVQRKWRLAETPALEGHQHYGENKILRLLELYEGDPIDDQVLGLKTQDLAEAYRKDYYADVKITWAIEPKDQEQALATVKITIDEGQRTRIRKIRFEGHSAMGSARLSKAIGQPRWWSPFRWFRKKRFDRIDIEIMQSQLRDLYLQQGHLTAEVGAPRYDREEGAVDMVFPIKEGPLYRFGAIRIDGVTVFDRAKVEELITARTGAVASSDVLRRSVMSVENYYGNRGYINARVYPDLDLEADEQRANLHLVLTEGRLVRVRNIKIQGNTRTRDKVIRRELSLYPGEILSRGQLARSERLVSNLGYFSSVRSQVLTTASEDERDIVLNVEEQRTGNMMVGAGFSSIDKLVGFFEVSQGNFDLFGWPHFTGGGQKLKLSAQLGSRRESYEVSFTEPWFLDRRLSLNLEGYRRIIDYRDYDQQTLGASVGIGRALPGNSRVNFRYRIEASELKDIVDTNEYTVIDTGESFYFTNEEDRVSSTFILSVTHDTRDNPFVPRRGTLATVFGSVSGGPLGCDTDLYRVGVRAAQHFPLWYGHVFTLKGRYETMDAHSDAEEVPLSERLFAGGGRTLRGFDYRDVGPKAVRTLTSDEGVTVQYDRPIGGLSLAVANAVYTIPLVQGVRFAGFFDAGNVWLERYELDASDLALSSGVGIRFDLPGFPVRIDRAWVIEKDDELTDSDSWNLWIGHDF